MVAVTRMLLFILTILWILTFIAPIRRTMARAVLAPYNLSLRRARWMIALSGTAAFVVGVTVVMLEPEDQALSSNSEGKVTSRSKTKSQSSEANTPGEPNLARVQCDPYRDTARQYYCHFSDFNFGGLTTPAHAAAREMASALNIDNGLAEACATEAEQDVSFYSCSQYDAEAFCNRAGICRSGDPPWPGAEPYFIPPER